MNSQQNSFEEVDILTSKVFDGDFTQNDFNKLTSLLENSKEARNRYTQLTLQESLLHWETASIEDKTESISSSQKVSFFPWFLSVAAAVVALFGVWWVHTNSTQANFSGSTKVAELGTSFAEQSVASNSPISPQSQFKLIRSSNIENLPYNTSLGTSKSASADAIYGIEILKSKKTFGEGGIVFFGDNISHWSRAEHLSVPMENGVVPKTGDQMMKFSPLIVDVDSKTAKVSETVKVLDVSELPSSKDGLSPQIQTTLLFNQGYNMKSDSTEFSLSFHAVLSNEQSQNLSIGHKSVSLESDINPTTWEEISEDFELPPGTDFVIVSMTAKKTGPGALLPDISGHYADGLSISLTYDGKNIIGPL